MLRISMIVYECIHVVLGKDYSFQKTLRCICDVWYLFACGFCLQIAHVCPLEPVSFTPRSSGRNVGKTTSTRALHSHVQTSDEDTAYERKTASDHDMWSTVLLRSNACDLPSVRARCHLFFLLPRVSLLHTHLDRADVAGLRDDMHGMFCCPFPIDLFGRVLQTMGVLCDCVDGGGIEVYAGFRAW